MRGISMIKVLKIIFVFCITAVAMLGLGAILQVQQTIYAAPNAVWYVDASSGDDNFDWSPAS